MNMANCKRILVIVAHSDDETIGMGGVIRRHVMRGDIVNIISMTDGVGARGIGQSAEVEIRNKSATLASEILGFTWQKQYGFDDNAMDTYPLLSIVKSIESTKAVVNPHIVYTHSGADLNVDHRVVANAVITAFRPQPDEACCEIRLFEVASATDYGHEHLTGIFSPNLFIDTTDTWLAKEAALNAYKAELREYPHSRSIQSIGNLAKLRGNQVGLYMAEAFQVLRKIER